MINDRKSFLAGLRVGLMLGRRIIVGIIAKLIRANGVYRASDEGADGYSMVTVDVPNTYTASDEGKVVQSGELVSQSAITVTQNGTYNTTVNDEVHVLVSGGGGTTVLSGASAPTSAQGSNGMMYLQYYAAPSGYTPLEYLAVDSAGPYIDTGVANTNTAYWEIECQYTDTPSNNYGIFGAQASSKEFAINTWQGTSFAIAGNTRVNFPSNTQLNKHKVFANSDGIYIDDVLSGAANWSLANNRNYYLFAINYTGGLLSTANAKIYYVKLYDGTTPVRYFIPAKRTSDDALGMYDLIDDQFYTNSGSGSFTAGPESTWPPTGNPITAAYAKVSGVWQSLIGTDINDVNLGGSGDA